MATTRGRRTRRPVAAPVAAPVLPPAPTIGTVAVATGASTGTTGPSVDAIAAARQVLRDAERSNFIDALKQHELSDEAAEALYAEGLTDYDTMSFYDGKNIEKTCLTLRKQGTQISIKAEIQLDLLCFGLALERTCNRQWIPPIEIPFTAWRERRNTVKAYVKPTEKFDLEGCKQDWSKIMKSLKEHLKKHRGPNTKAPLTYVLRDNPMCPPQTGGLLESLRDTYGGSYDRMLEARCLHYVDNDKALGFHSSYLQDNEEVFEIIAHIFRNHLAHTYVQPFAKTNDGRGAFMNLRDMFLGKDHASTRDAELRNQLEALAYHGERRRWTFERFSARFIELFNEINDLTSLGMKGMADCSAVQQLLNSIKTKELDIVKGQIAIKKNKLCIEEAIKRVTAYITSITNQNVKPSTSDDTRQIGAVHGGSPSSKRKRGDRSSTVELRYYTPAEYNKLTSEQKTALRHKRHKPNGKAKSSQKDKNTGQIGTSQLDAISAQMATAIISAVGAARNPKSDDSSDDEGDKKPAASNRSHKGLTRQKKESS